MKKAAIIDLSFHKKTKSFDFIKNIISTNYKIEYFFDEILDGGKLDKEYLHKSFDIYIYLQAFPTLDDLQKIKDQNIVLVPMYDSSALNKYAWEYYKGFKIKIICFCKRLYDFLIKEGFDCIYLQYFLTPISGDINYEGKRIFFWYRGQVTFDEIKNIIGNQHIDLLTIKNVPDPGYSKLTISSDDIKKYNIQFLERFFDTHEEHYAFLREHNIFIAPRKKEGIGMSFLEPLSMGQCVIAYDEATMNEYITNGVNGFTSNLINKIDLTAYVEIGKKAKEQYSEGFTKRNNNKNQILDFINGNYKRIKTISILDKILFKLIKIRRLILKIIK